MTSRDGDADGLVQDYVDGRIDRRQFFRRAAAIGLSLPAASAILAACGGGGGAATTAPATSAAATTGAATSEATTAATTAAAATPTGPLTLRMNLDISNLDPAFYPADVDENVASSIYEGLVTYKPGTFDVVNQLADTFTPSSDGLSFDFTLKQGIQFHGGYGEVTADDVKYSYERLADLTTPKLNSPYKGDWAPQLKEVAVKDKYSGTIVLKEPFAALMRSTLPVFSGVVLSKKAVEERGKKYATHPIGTGPYEFVSWTPKQQTIIKRFAQYGGASNDYIGSPWPEIHFLPIPDDNAADIALESGQVDFGRISLPGVDRFAANDSFATDQRLTLGFNWIGMNILHPKLKDIRVRQAIRLALDVPSMIQAGFEGKWTQATAIIPKEMGLGYWPDAPVYDRDANQAKSLLQQAGVSNLELTYIYCTCDSGAAEVAQIAQQNLADVGIKLTLKPLDSATYFTLGKQERERELFYVGYVTEPDPSWSTVWFVCRQFDQWNWMYWCDKQYDALHYAALKEFDDSKRNDMYIQMQQLWDKAAHTVWVAWPTNFYAWKKSIQPSITPHGRVPAYAFKAV
jgi:peptide/nickel transport system substrate-binding protein